MSLVDSCVGEQKGRVALVMQPIAKKPFMTLDRAIYQPVSGLTERWAETDQCALITFPLCTARSNERPAYETLGRFFALGYIRGQIHAIYGAPRLL